MKNKTWTDAALIAQLATGDEVREAAWRFIFENWRDILRARVREKGGENAEADAALAACCIDFERAVTAPGFQIEDSLLAYLSKCVVNAWIKNSKKEAARPEDGLPADLENRLFENTPYLLADPEIAAELDNIIEQAVGEKCHKVLRQFAERFSMKRIAGFLGKSEAAAKEKKHDCQKKIRQWLAANPAAKNRLTELVHG